MSCPDDNALTEFVAGVLSPGAADALEAHIDVCPPCRNLLAEIARSLPGGSAGGDAEPEAVLRDDVAGYLGGRYVPERILGGGGMSIVYQGVDRVLKRPVALKVMLDAPQDVRARLRREARALGMLSHPNVVDVYDVDVTHGSAFLACQYIDGGSLRVWLSLAPRTWTEILDVILDASRGLAAAHRVGLVHRDVTPNNVLVGTDGRGRVADFGLARLPRTSVDTAEKTLPESGKPVRGVAPPRWVGTPGYVAPEVRAGASASEAADQYGLCMTAYEAMLGRRPGQPPPTGTRTGVAGAAGPRAIVRVLDRGLHFDPAARYPSIDALRRALQRARTPVSRGRIGLLAATIAGIAAVGWSATESPQLPCDRATPVLLSTAQRQLPRPVAQAAEAYAAQWHDVRQRTCQADQQHLSARSRDLRWTCLGARRNEFALADPYYDEALALTRKVYGSDSLRYATRLMNAGVHNALSDRPDVAHAQLRQAQQRCRALLGPDSPCEADNLTNLAGLEITRHNYPRAAELATAALAIQQRHVQDDDPRVAMLLGIIGQALVFDEQPAQAVPYLERAVAIRTTQHPISHPVVINAHYQLALAFSDVQRFADAERVLNLALAEIDGPSVTAAQRGAVLIERGELSLEQDDRTSALTVCTRAVTVLSDPSQEPWLTNALACRERAQRGAPS